MCLGYTNNSIVYIYFSMHIIMDKYILAFDDHTRYEYWAKNINTAKDTACEVSKKLGRSGTLCTWRGIRVSTLRGADT